MKKASIPQAAPEVLVLENPLKEKEFTLATPKHSKSKMGLFDFLTQEIAIDLGTANTLIIHNDKIVVDEPSIVAIDRMTGKVIAVGRQAMMMHGKTHENIKTIRPLKDGVIADFDAAEHMIRGMIKMINPGRKFFQPSLKMVICIPSGITEVEKRAVRDSAEHAGAKEVYLIHEPMAAAIGIGIDVEEPMGNMIIDIGGGTSEIAVIALGGIVCDQSIRVAGDGFTMDIWDYMRRQHNILIGERSAEMIKIEVGSALPELDNAPVDYAVHGRDLMTGIPKEITVSYSEIAHALDKSISKIEEAILKALEMTPPELSADIYRTGIYLTGGGALLRGLDKRLAMKTKLPVHVAEDPLRAVVRGTGIALKNIERFKFLIP
jgi:rod shape-determining protein MreB